MHVIVLADPLVQVPALNVQILLALDLTCRPLSQTFITVIVLEPWTYIYSPWFERRGGDSSILALTMWRGFDVIIYQFMSILPEELRPLSGGKPLSQTELSKK